MTPTVAQALARARRSGLDRLDAQLLLAHHLQRPRAWLIAHDEVAIADDVARAFDADVARRADGWPLAYLVGRREFHGLMLEVTPDVLVPRPDTETLVAWAIERLAAGAQATPRVVDLGTGSGAIALALAHAVPRAIVCATDLDEPALVVARTNAARLGLAVDFAAGHWWTAVGTRRFDLVVSNPPYIAHDDPHLPALRHEPLRALSDGADGLSAIREIVANAPRHMHRGAWLLLEHGHDQADAVRGLLAERGFVDIGTRNDIEDRPRCSGGRWNGSDRTAT